MSNFMKDVWTEIRDHKVATVCYVLSGVCLAQKMFGFAIVWTLFGVGHRVIDWTIDSGIREATLHTWKMMDEAAKLQLVRISNIRDDDVLFKNMDDEEIVCVIDVAVTNA
jgi:hypothetical protein